jgi:AcrR family transcriptional regulator
MARPMGPRGQGRARVLSSALELFADQGVSGTSLQMIADHLGVTKAAVYYQFKAKEDIVLAVLEPAFAQMRTVVSAAEVAATPDAAAELAVEGLVDLVIDHRRIVATLFRDPEVERIVQAHEEFQSLTSRLGQLLQGPRPHVRRRVTVSVLGAGLAHAGLDLQLADVDDGVLRDELMHLGRTLLAAAQGAPAT